MNYILLFLAVVIGYAIATFLQKKEVRHMSLYLAFSGAFLLSITVFELLPEVFEDPVKSTGLFIMGGILLQIFLEFFSKGAEHGHLHVQTKDKAFPWILFISLSIHALLEGFPISEKNNLLIGIIIHKIPIAIILSLFFMKANYSRLTSLSFLFLFALMTPLGSYMSQNFSGLFEYEKYIAALVIGIFLHVSTTILFESSKDHRFNLAKLLTIIAAVIIAYFL